MEEILQQYGTTIGVVVGVIVLLFFVRSLLRGKKADPAAAIQENVRCKSCGWQGIVSKYNRVCSKCNSSSLEKFG